MGHTYNFSIQGTEVEKLPRVWGQPELHSKTLLKANDNKNQKPKKIKKHG